jgi:hypothetical protein
MMIHAGYSMVYVKAQRGFLLITSVVLIVVASLLLTVMMFLAVTGDDSSVAHSQSGQGFFIVESGAEFEQRRLAQNLNWYRTTTDPFDITSQSMGEGSFTVQAQVPASLLRTRIPTAASTAPIRVYTTNRFPCPACADVCGPCYLQIDDDISAGGEFVQYTGIAGDTFTGITRNRTIGTVTAAAPSASYERGTSVYPVTTLITAIGSAVCTAALPNPFQITAHSKFLSAGTIDIEGEEFTYTGSSVSGTTMTLTGVKRCQNSPPVGAVHPAGRPVTPVLTNVSDTADYEAEMLIRGTVGPTAREARKTVRR